MNIDKFYPKVSIIIPVYNGSNYVREAIDSALSQSYKNIEIIVVDDGSCDNGSTEEIALSYGDRIRYFAKENGGVATALNFGIENMSGEYFSWLSHDDLYCTDKIARQVEILSNITDKKTILYGGYSLINEKSEVTGEVRPHEKYPQAKLDIPLFPLMRGLVNGCVLLVHVDHFKNIGMFNPELKTTQDYALWFEIFRHTKIKYHNDILVKTRIHDDRGTFKIPNHLEECNALWVGFLNSITEEEMGEIDDTPFLFYTNTAAFLGETLYSEAKEYAQGLARKKNRRYTC